jgi:hypothetical protein
MYSWPSWPRPKLKVSSQSHAQAALPPVKEPPYSLDNSWVGHRTDLDDVERRKISLLPGLNLRSLGRTVRNQSLYQNRVETSGTGYIQCYYHSSINGSREREKWKIMKGEMAWGGSVNRSNSANSRKSSWFKSAKISCLTQQPDGLGHETRLPQVPGTQGQGQSS